MRRALREILQTAILAFVLFFALQASVQNYRVAFASMEPTLYNGEYLLVNKLVYLRLDSGKLERLLPFVDFPEETLFPFHSPHRGDVVVLIPPGDRSRKFIKRVVGMPGETIRIHQGQVFINDQLLEEPYLKETPSGYFSSGLIPPGRYFVMGDNREVSNDSRAWGPVPLEDIIGKAWVTYWPLSLASTVNGHPTLAPSEE